MGQPWRRADYVDKLPVNRLLPPDESATEPPAWVEAALVTCILSLVVAVVLLAILHPTVAG